MASSISKTEAEFYRLLEAMGAWMKGVARGRGLGPAFINEYETPLAEVRGVFLCEDLADTLVSARGTIVQEDWDPADNTDIGGGADPQGNITFHFD